MMFKKLTGMTVYNMVDVDLVFNNFDDDLNKLWECWSMDNKST
jgi:hypothetical protein